MHFLFTLLLLAGLVHTDFDYSHLGTEDGLKGQHIFAVGQTPDGVIWWAGKNTVDRYNGHQVKNYWLDKDAPYSHFSGRTIGEEIAAVRIERAKSLLKRRNVAVGAVHAMCGYPDPSSFRRAFRKCTGQSPLQWRNGGTP